MPSALSWYVSIRFVSLLSTPFEEWEAFKMGLIDKEGRKIRSPKTTEERAQFTSWMNIVRNIRRVLSTVPGGATKFSTFAAALALIREEARTRSGGKIDRITEKVIIDDLMSVMDPMTRRSLISESPSRINYLDPGTYCLVSGPELFLRSEENRPITVRVQERTAPSHSFFGHHVFELIDNENKRIFACRDHLSLLDR